MTHRSAKKALSLGEESVSQLFEMQVLRTPEAIAISYQHEQLTYHNLNVRANQLAHYLQQRGVGLETRVGMCLERSLDMVIGLLAILKAGGAYVPLDLTYPQERLAFMLQDACISLLLVQERLLAHLPPHAATVVVHLDIDWPAIALHRQENIFCQTNEENAAYVIYTSGSTGRPKGVVVSHKAINRLVLKTNYIQITTADRIAQASTTSFDAATFEIWGALLNGAQLIGVSREVLLAPQAFATYLVQERISILFLTTALLNQVVEEIPNAFRFLRYLLFGGEAATPKWIRSVLMHGKPAHLLHVYGPTENTTFSTWYPVEKAVEEAATIPIGFPIANTTAYVLDPHMQPVPSGVLGEVYVSGSGLARGYLNQPGLTADRFVPDWLSGRLGERLYKTGDLARYLPDGTLDFMGRLDQQVKLRGFRIELEEIEAVLHQHPGVRNAIVLLREDVPSQKRLVAYVVREPEQQPKVSLDELRLQMQAHLPGYMLPSSITLLEALPLTPNGKVDRSALPLPEEQRSGLKTAYIAPRTPVEEALISIWVRVLRCEQIGIHDNFFELGGHSLLATQVISRMRDVFGVAMPFRVLFEMPTVAELAQQIEAAKWTGGKEQIPSLRSVQRKNPLCLSYAQERLWFLDQFAPNNPFYTISHVWHLEGWLRIAALEQSLNALVHRHEVLRTRFIADDGRPMQVIVPDLHITLSVVDLTLLPADEQERQVQHLIHTQAQTSFDLAQVPLLRAYLLRTGERTHKLLLALHHIITDGWSMGILFHELAIGYQATLGGSAPALAAIPIQYADYAIWQREWLRGNVLALQLSYWHQQLAGAPTLLSLPTDRPRPAMQTFRGASHRFVLSPDLSRALEAFSQQEGVTLFMTLLATFAVLLARYSRQDDLLIATPVANRMHEELEGMIGFFVNMLPLRLDLSEPHHFRQLLQHVREVALEAYAHQELPFERLVEEMRPERNASHAPLCQVVFALQNMPLEPLELAELRLESWEVESETIQFDLILEMTPNKGGLEGKLQYSRELFEAETIERLSGHYQRLLAGVIQPHEEIGYLPLLTEVERQVLVEEWNATQQVYPNQQSVHALVEEQVTHRHEAVALVCAEEHLTFGKLNQRANQLARYLRGMGVGAEHLVGVCLERGVALVVSLLAILKTGGAYVPLDPTYPTERLTFMLQDTQLSVLLTTSTFGKKGVGQNGQGRRLVCLDNKEEQEHLAQQCLENVACQVDANNLAYVIYTSGSTGRPKGVQITHRGLRNLVCWHQQAFALTPQDRVSQVASVSFDAAGWEIWSALAAGAMICMIEDEVRSAPLQMCTWLAEQQITRSFLPTPLAESLLGGQWPTGLALQTLLTGGDMLHRAPGHDLPFVLVNNYGPTEATVVTTSGVVMPTRGDAVAGAPTIGRPIANTWLYVLDRYMQPVPIGVNGELYIGGEGLARGYLHRAELTAERFVPNPFANLPGLRLYKTGDLVRYRTDGSLDFRGRNDEQVKIRGFRIEPGEIEAALRQHYGIKDAVVIAHADKSGEKRLVAYLEPEPALPFTLSQLRQHLQARLPHYMIPATIITLERLPLSPTGKLDRMALPAPVATHSVLGERYEPPHNAIEEVLVGIWMEVLGVERVGVYDNFFELGGHSLLATRMIARIQHAFQVKLPLRSLFAQPQLIELAQAVAQMLDETASFAPESAIQSTVEQDAERLLARLDQLSAAEVDELLSSLLSKRKEND